MTKRVFCAAGMLSLPHAAVGGEVLYGIGSGVFDGSSNLYRIDDPLGSPVGVDLGETGAGVFDIAISPVTGKAYGIAGAALLSIDLGTAQAATIGFQTYDTSQNALEFTPDGTLYSWGFEDTRLFRVDPATGSAEPVFDLKALAGGDLAAASDTVLYGTTGLALIKIDIATQTRTVIGAHGDALKGALLFGLEMDSAGNLIGLTGTEGAEVTSLFRIDGDTGEASWIGDLPDSYLLGGYGLAYAVPGPGGWLIFAAGAGLARRRRT